MHRAAVVVAASTPATVTDLISLAIVTWARAYGEPAHGHELHLLCCEPGAWPAEKSAVLVDLGSDRWAEEGDRVSFIVTEDPACRDLAGYLGRLTYEPEPA